MKISSFGFGLKIQPKYPSFVTITQIYILNTLSSDLSIIPNLDFRNIPAIGKHKEQKLSNPSPKSEATVKKNANV